jgi:predicted signal transduction protein with EAL and GGDEF domain
LLIQVGQRLSELVADLGHLVARLGGDEFVVLVEATTGTEDAIKVADRVLAVLGEPFNIDGRHLRVTASIGIVERAVAESDPTDVMRAADITLHWAKADGKARWAVFDSERNAHEVARYTLAAEMPAALERGEFALVYQPIVGLADGRLIGVEALARWHHPRLRTLAPDRFIDLAEESGLIVKLGIRLLEQACGQAVRWTDLVENPPYVSVNLAVRQIHTPGLVADIAAVLDRTGLPAHRLQLEITESAVMGNDATTLATLHDLANLGVRLAIDDFGTGYSNLVYLRSLPVHALKLAGQFLRDLHSPTDEAILQILVSLGRTMDLTVTAEGVETPEQVRLLQTLHCDTGQGWHFGRPAPPEDIARLIAGD